jgi:hypothetical protein
MGMFSPDKYFRDLYPDAFRETTPSEVISYLFVFFLLMSAYYLYLRFFERKERILIDNNKQEVGDEIDYKFHGNVLSYKLIIRKVSNTDWVAYKQFRSGRNVPLRKGDLRKIIDYMNRNFGYDNEVVGFE